MSLRLVGELFYEQVIIEITVTPHEWHRVSTIVPLAASVVNSIKLWFSYRAQEIHFDRFRACNRIILTRRSRCPAVRHAAPPAHMTLMGWPAFDT